MAIQVETFQKPSIEVQWSVDIPKTDSSEESEWFSLKGDKWMLRFTVSWDYSYREQLWTMNLLHEGNNTPAIFPITTCLRNKDKKLFVSHTLITGSSTTLWTYHLNLFSSKCPGNHTSGNTLMFIFVFEFDTLTTKSFYLEHRFVQTHAYFDDRQCWESLSRDLRKLMEADRDSDVVLKCGDCTVPAHKLVLGTRSEVFRNMLQSDMQEGRDGSVHIADMKSDVFRVFVRYLYTGSLPELTEDLAISLFEAGDKYLVAALRGRCSEFLAENLTRENACRILVLADAHSDGDLKDRVISYVVDEKIPNDDDVWQDFCDSHPKLANEVLNRAYKRFVSSL